MRKIPGRRSMRESIAIARHEIAAFFISLSSLLLLAIFVAAVVFHFFWIESFFARNIADVRPMFEWLALLMILLAASLTMRSWSEERRSGTIELLLTSPVSTWRLVTGKYIAVMGIMLVALLLTIPIPVMVAFTGDLDPGPVASGYAGLLLLASAYISIGLFVSSKTDNPIVSLTGSVTLCGLLHLLGSDSFTGYFGYRTAEWLGYFSSSMHLESLLRGVIDPGDLLFFVVVTLLFLSLNRLSLDALRPAGEPSAVHAGRRMLTLILVIILLLLNLAASRISLPRLDLTGNSRYTLSETTRSTLESLDQPLLLRGYFTERTHPMLNALVPRMQDLLEEYRIAGEGRVRVEIVDPHKSPELEQEAAEKYGIEPTAFQTADRYQASLVSSYFDLLVQYGDQFQTLNYADLIEVKTLGETDLEVRLRNPEYDLTAAIRKVLFAQRTHENLFDSIPGKIRFRAFISDDSVLPEKLVTLKQDLGTLLETLRENAAGKLEIVIEDPQQDDGSMVGEIRDKYGFRPMVVALDKAEEFFFYMLIENDQRVVPVPLPDSLDMRGLQSAISTGLRNFAPGVLRKIALVLPPDPIMIAGFRQKGYATWYQLEKRLRDSVMVEKTNLASGRVPRDADLLVVVAPESLGEVQLFAIDQFLMQGGTVIVAASPWQVRLSSDAISAEKQPSGIESWLLHHGISIGDTLVMDTQLGYFPIPVRRQLGSKTVEEIRQLAYPYFIDVREENLDTTTGIFAGINQLTMNWASPLMVDNASLEVTRLVSSSDQSWLDATGGIQPDFEKWPETGFDAGEGQERKARALAILTRGTFSSWFAGKPLPTGMTQAGTGDSGAPVEVIEQSPRGTRLAVIGSGIFLADSVIDLQTQAMGTRYLGSLQFIQNLVDRVFEEPGLLALRGRGDYARMLHPLTRKEQQIREIVATGTMFASVILLFFLVRLQGRRRTRYLQHQLEMND
ncbi:MAG: Gldg family protein [Chromatiales bacterium]|jgi:ABC-2 type transport system permease protein